MTNTQPKIINLALQGGGAHGALTWGALDYLLEDGRLEFEGISATSAGAFNAVVLAQGLLNNNKQEARDLLHSAWKTISEMGESYNVLNPMWSEHDKDGNYSDYAPSFAIYDLISRLFSPYELNPMDINPLRAILEDIVDFAAVRQRSKLKIHLCATNIETCKIHIFKNDQITVDAVLASSCLPYYMHAVEINGEYLWDGGYIGNPAIFPLIYDCTSRDILIIHLTSIVRKGVPKTAQDILHRMHEITFNVSLMREMRAIAFISKLIDEGKLNTPEVKRVFMHSIRSDEEMNQYSFASRVNTHWDFLTSLRDKGRDMAKKWLETHYGQIGTESSVDLEKEFL